MGDMSRLTVAIYANPVAGLVDLPALASINSISWLPGDWQSFKALLLKNIPVLIVGTRTTVMTKDMMVLSNFADADRHASELADAWIVKCATCCASDLPCCASDLPVVHK
jgi:hypothetical protein